MTVRIAGTAAHLERISSIPDIADYVDSLVLSLEQIDDFAQSPEYLARGQKKSLIHRKEPVLPLEVPEVE